MSADRFFPSRSLRFMRTAAKEERPSFIDAAKGEKAIVMYDKFNNELRKLGFHVEEGIFGADMKIELLNDGPVTIWLDSETIV